MQLAQLGPDGRRQLEVDAAQELECVVAEWLCRELWIVEPKLVVVMGDDALEFLGGIDFQLSSPIRPELGELQRFSPTIEGLYVPDIDLSLDEGPAKTAFWNAFKAVGPWWAELPPY